MDEQRSHKLVRASIPPDPTDIRASCYNRFIQKRINQIKDIVDSPKIDECLHELVIFETMTFFQKLRILEFTCRFLLSENAHEGKQEFSFDLSEKAIRELGVNLPSNLRFYYRIDKSLCGFKSLNLDQKLSLHRLQAELAVTMVFVRKTKDSLKRLMIFIDQE